MKVLFDAYWWVRGPVSNRQVMRELIAHWVARFPEDDVTLVLRRRHVAAADDLPPRVRTRTTRLWPHGIAAILRYPALARAAGVDVTITHNFAPALGPSAVFVHDVMFQASPEWFTRAERAYYALIPLLLSRADVVLTSSATEARRIERRNPRVEAVHPIGLAVGLALAEASPVLPAGVAPDQRFVLSVGRLNVRKNLAFTFEALLRADVIDAERPLLVVGEPQGVGIELGTRVADAVERGVIRFLGRIGDGELAWLYGHADAFVYLSLDEGFGLPPLEALTFGCPVVVSDLAVFRENLGDNAAYVDPRDLDAAVGVLRASIGAPRPQAGEPDLPTWTGCVERMRSAVLRALPELP